MKHIVFSDYVNAWSIKKGLKKLGHDTYLVDNKNKLFKFINKKDIKKNDILFFTDENSLSLYVNKESNHFEPKFLDKKIFDDKLAFANYLEGIHETPIPSKPFNNKDNSYPYYLKCRHSWVNGKKLPRGYIIHSQANLKKALEQINNNEWDINWFFHQKLLNSNSENNISASGYFDYSDNKRNAIILTKKTIGSTKTMSTGAAIETVRDPANLIERTINILNKLKYKGPFELEFFYENKDDIYYILELNPRFWMQHGILIKHYNNAILKRYLYIEGENELYSQGIPEFKHLVWIDTTYLLYCLLKLNLHKVINLLTLKGKKNYFPNIQSSFYFLIIKYKKSILKRLKKNE